MSVLICGMEMPKPKLADMATVYHAYVLVSPNGHAAIVVDNEDGLDSTEYSLVPVTPHGRLIDADALTETTDGVWDCNDLYFQPNDKICDPKDCKGCKWRETMDCFRRMVKHAPTIIPASEEVEA